MRAQALIFDFDDTLVDTYGLFMRYYQRFAQRMAELELAAAETALATLHQTDVAVVTRLGYPSLDSFPLALLEAYRLLLAGQAPQPQIEAELLALGRAVHEDKPTAYADAEPLLASLAGRVRLLLLTQGDEAAQLARVRRSGFARYFQRLAVVEQKTPAVYRALLAEAGLSAAGCWMVGNSMRSDINPALAAGLQAIHLQRTDWSYDAVPPQGAYRTVTDLREVGEVIGL